MMSYRPCVVIPIYNHKDTIAAVAEHIVAAGLPVLIVDDGSDAATQEVLRNLTTYVPQVRCFRLERNGGKGAAVIRGFCEADKAGYTHALQVDADGQHDLGDLERFLAQSRTNPDAVVSGQPLYDGSAPKSRRYGRYATHVWVWIETLSFAIADSMCGFRVYPLKHAVELIDRHHLPSRMDFDTEVIVRLFWAGVPVINVPTRVIYPENGLSHFKVLRDNLRISWMHTRLFFGMLPRMPLLLWRKFFPRSFRQAHWSKQQERGNARGMHLTIAAYRLLGDKAVRLLLRPLVAWFFLSGKTARKASQTYLARLHAHAGDTPAPTWANSYRHMLAFADSAVDKFAAWTGRLTHANVAFERQPEFERLLASGQGAVLLGAHLGNMEMLRALANLNGIAKVNAVVYTAHAKRFADALASASPAFQINLLQVDGMGPDTAILLQERIARGELLVIVGDRTPPAENGRVVTADFLGRPALFPQGPFILAALLGCPVYLFFCTKGADNTYRIEFELLTQRIELPRGRRAEAIASYAQRYADRLTELCRAVPFQWFNFFDFWAMPAASPINSTNALKPSERKNKK
jgi:predicted LPLAT superfamily acyltransferase